MSAKDGSHLWVEKYRPRGISDIAHQEEITATLQKSVKESAGRGDLPHLLFYGPPGTGKTSTAIALCRDLFGPHNLKSRVLELNASDERGIKVVREKIKTFAQTTISSISTTKGSNGKAYPCPPFKIIILDEADAITRDAQTALRRTMEAHSRVTRFIIICNYISRIIGPLTSRCAKFRFNSLSVSSMTVRLRKISETENVKASDETLQSLIAASEGDLRKAINTLQSAHRMLADDEELTTALMSATACLVPTSIVDHFDLATCAANGTNAAVRKAVDEIMNAGYSALQLLAQYTGRLLGNTAVKGVTETNDLQKAAIAIVVAETEKALIDGCDEKLQLYNAASRISRICGLSSRSDAAWTF